MGQPAAAVNVGRVAQPPVGRPRRADGVRVGQVGGVTSGTGRGPAANDAPLWRVAQLDRPGHGRTKRPVYPRCAVGGRGSRVRGWGWAVAERPGRVCGVALHPRVDHARARGEKADPGPHLPPPQRLLPSELGEASVRRRRQHVVRRAGADGNCLRLALPVHPPPS
eukprot:scaffold15414_cov114-Isochrysis_galbana.AAC.4